MKKVFLAELGTSWMLKIEGQDGRVFRTIKAAIKAANIEGYTTVELHTTPWVDLQEWAKGFQKTEQQLELVASSSEQSSPQSE